MQGWLGVVQVLGVLAGLLAASILLLAGRRRWLNRLGGTFECSLRLRMRTPGAGWVLGVGRYSEGILEWFRYFSYSLRPRMVFPRRSVRVLETRMPNPVEAVALNGDEKVVRLEMQDGHAETQWELAMSEESVTGLLSWLEAAPPGVRRFE
jgi:Protein of unknown function (DUF2550)